ncbi:MAG: hypothetical protein MZV64_42620 [Ignavibacteriales bacterium]|nr:hypothetical protein [Ignavibacteriales bacterium]
MTTQGLRAGPRARSTTTTTGPGRPRSACRGTPSWTRWPAPRWRSGSTSISTSGTCSTVTYRRALIARAVPAQGISAVLTANLRF